MSKYTNGLYFISTYSNISPPATSFDMARSSSRESAISGASTCYFTTSAYGSLATTHPLSRTSSNTSSTHSSSLQHSNCAPTSEPMRRSSSSSSISTSAWAASPYRSCLTPSYEETPNSYLSDDDLLNLSIPVESIPSPSQKRDLTTEEQIQHLREVQEREDREERQRRELSSRSSKKQVRFESEPKQSRRPSQLKRRSTTVRKGLATLNGPQ